MLKTKWSREFLLVLCTLNVMISVPGYSLLGLKVILYLKGHFNFIDIIVFQQHELCRGIIDYKDKNKLWIEDDVQSSFIKL